MLRNMAAWYGVLLLTLPAQGFNVTQYLQTFADEEVRRSEAPMSRVGCQQHGFCRSCIRDSCGWCETDQRCHSARSTCGADHAPADTNLSSCPREEPRQTGFSRLAAREMGYYASAVYYDNPAEHGLPPGTKVVKTFKYKIGLWDDAFGFIALNEESKRIVLAFRGSETLTQVAVEILFHNLVAFHGDKEARVNEFFLWAVDDLLPQITPELQKLEDKCPECELWVTGHSLGASMALLAGYNISFWTRVQPTLYTYGQPRSVNGAFARLVEKRMQRIYRLVNAADPVPHLPRCTRDGNGGCRDDAPGGYHHVGTELWFPSGDYLNGVMCEYRECVGLPAGEDLSCADGLSAVHSMNILDHHGYWAVVANGFCGVGAGADGDSVVLV